MNSYSQVRVPDAPAGVGMPCGKSYVHRLVLFAKVGAGPHPCHWCGCELDWTGLGGITVDHLNGIKSDNAPANTVVSCQQCNRGRATGVLDIRLPDRATEILTHSPIKTHFGCGCPLGFLVDLDNVYVWRGYFQCWQCHRQRARDRARRQRAAKALSS